jgi:hypothetical protein
VRTRVVLLAVAAGCAVEDLAFVDESLLQHHLPLALSHHPSLEFALELIAGLGSKRSLAVVGSTRRTIVRTRSK